MREMNRTTPMSTLALMCIKAPFSPVDRVGVPSFKARRLTLASHPYEKDGRRLVFIDALRVAAIAFVIIHHAAQAYGPTGGFWPVHDRGQSGWFAPFYTANAAFGMGLLFLLAGYFVPQAYDRKGAWLFLKERFGRIGIPLAAFALLVHLPMAYLLAGSPAPRQFLYSLYERGWQPVYAHLWFVAHLLLYCVAYAGWRCISQRSEGKPIRLSLPSHAAVASFIVALALITWLVRIWYPVDKWVPFLGIMPAEPAHLPQYMAFFTVGVVAYRGDWFRRTATSAALIWLAVGVIASGGIYVAYAFGWWKMAPGGLSLESLLRSSWETVIAVGLSVGLIVAFRELFDRPNRLIEAMSAASFGAYILHLVIVIALQTSILNLPLSASVKFGVVSVVGTWVAFVIAHVAGKVPGIGALVGEIHPSNFSGARRGNSQSVAGLDV
jgi:surface polysaccharide O-acyltransferase-like enzyme